MAKKEKECKYYAFDIETSRWNENNPNKSNLEFKFGYLLEFNKEFQIVNEYFIENIENDFWNRLLENDILKYVYIHNLDFDFLFTIESLAKQSNLNTEVKISAKIIEIRVQKEIEKIVKKEKVKKKEAIVIFRNTFVIWATSLSEIGKNIGIEKLENDKTFNSITEQDKEYCKRDCEIIVRFLEFWFQKISELYQTFNIEKNLTLESITLTISATAKKLALEMNKGLEFLNNFKDFDEKFRPFYFGGRCEVFDFNIKEVYYYDINSLYPFICINHEMPTFPLFLRKGSEIDSNTIAVFAYVQENESFAPVIPERIENKVIFRNGVKYALLQIEEYEYLRTRPNTKILIKETVQSQKAFLFKHLQKLYDMRMQFKKDKNPFQIVCKLLMNCSYGFCGTKRERESMELLQTDSINPKNQDNLIIMENEILEIKKETKEIDTIRTNVFIALRITALARLFLTKILHKVHENGYRVHYCDTDSVICEKNPACDGLLGNELGQFKIENEGLFVGVAPKMYLIVKEKDIEIRAKGLHANNINELKQYFNEGIVFVRPCKLKEMLREGTLIPFQIKGTKRLQTFYDKRIIQDNLTTQAMNEMDDIKEIERQNMFFIQKNIEFIEKLKEVKNE